MNKSKTYYPIINGDVRKYKVEVLKPKIIITDLKTEKEILMQKYKKIFIGKNSKKYGPYDKPYLGSSILVEIGYLEYIYICETIFKFKTKEPVTKFYSTMGNNFVVYPFALTENYAYLMNDNVYMLRDFGDIDPYEVYYDFKKEWNHKSFKFSSKMVVNAKS